MKTIDINTIAISDYDYNLPKESIAEYPLQERENSKLLFADNSKNTISHHKFADIGELLPQNSMLVINVTRVISARILMKKETGGNAEILCVEPLLPSIDPQITMQARGKCSWKCIIGGRNLIVGSKLTPRADNASIQFEVEIIDRDENTATVEFLWQPVSLSFAEVINHYGITPLPPYIKREVVESDKERYQTVFADYDGSVAAPTAGLHFTPKILETIKEKGITSAEVTLHVGPGTFQPVVTEFISDHKMHSERIIVSRKVIIKLLEYFEHHGSDACLIATGTTSLRTLESLYWLGVSLSEITNIIDEPKLEQWSSYELSGEMTTVEALENIIKYLDNNKLHYFVASTSLLIVPGYEFKLVKGLITNYHLPKSTLILLVAAFVGKDRWREIYDSAIENNYRFLSYGDSSFLLR